MYLRKGYYLERNLIDVSHIKAAIASIFFNYHQPGNLNKTLIDLFAKDPEGFVGCAQMCQCLPELIHLSTAPKIVSRLRKLGLKRPVTNTKPLISFSCQKTAKNEYYWKLPAHQDWPSTQGSLNGVTCWMPLVDTTDVGPLEISPGSHLAGPLPHTETGVPVLLEEPPKFIPIPMQPNDALFFSNFTVHRSGLNATDRVRISMHFRYDDAFEPTFVQRKYPQQKIEVRRDGNSLPTFPFDEFHRIFPKDIVENG